MNACRFNEKLSAYYDGELDGDEREAFERHLGACAPCAEELNAMRVFSGALQTQTAHIPIAVKTRLRVSAYAMEREALTVLARRFAVAAVCLLVASGIALTASNRASVETDSTAVESTGEWTSVAVNATADYVPWDNPEAAYTAWMVERLEEALGDD